MNDTAIDDTSTNSEPSTQISTERQDLVAILNQQRRFLRFTAGGLTDDQATATPTTSALCVGGIIKHVAGVEEAWSGFMETGTHPHMSTDMDWESITPEQMEAYHNEFQLLDGETLAGVLAQYEAVAANTNRLVETLPDLDQGYELPPAPWFTPGTSWTVRRTILHILAETAQHCGHADIIRESIDGQKTMG